MGESSVIELIKINFSENDGNFVRLLNDTISAMYFLFTRRVFDFGTNIVVGYYL